jgi:hypothetical protein
MPRGRQPYRTIEGVPLTTEDFDRVGEMLRLGSTYEEVALACHLTESQVKGLNFWRFKVGTHKAFKARILRNGIPNRLVVSDAFGYWFSGFFDGEGCLGFSLPHGVPDGITKRSRWLDIRATILMRADNNEALVYVRQNLGIGNLTLNQSYACMDRPGTKSRSVWTCRVIADICEVLIPLFDSYPMRTKKREEFPLWKEAANLIYANTMAGISNRSMKDGFSTEDWSRLAEIGVAMGRLKRWESSGD